MIDNIYKVHKNTTILCISYKQKTQHQLSILYILNLIRLPRFPRSDDWMFISYSTEDSF